MFGITYKLFPNDRVHVLGRSTAGMLKTWNQLFDLHVIMGESGSVGISLPFNVPSDIFVAPQHATLSPPTSRGLEDINAIYYWRIHTMGKGDSKEHFIDSLEN
ncbi:hypothetical protein ACJX0J_015281, partial [Zea mays]